MTATAPTIDREERATATPLSLLALVFVVSLNLQSQIFAMGPLLPRIADDLGLTSSAVGILAAIPALLMGLVAIPGGRLADRWGAARSLAAGLALVALAGILRAFAPGWPVLLALTVLLGIGIGVAQPAMPAFFRRRMPEHLGTATGVYTFGLVIGIICASALTGPLIAPLAGGWRGALLFWGVCALLALGIWLLGVRPWREARTEATAVARETADWSPWRDRAVWIAAAVYAAQGLVYFLLVLWLPAVYAEAGLSEGDAGARLAVLTGASIPATFLFPAWIERGRSIRLPLIASVAISLAGGIGFAVATATPPVDWLWPVLVGFGTCGMLIIALVLTAEAAPAGRTGDAAGVVLAVGYVLTALGPFLAGVIRDATGGFRSAMLVLPVICAATLLLAFVAPDPSPPTETAAGD